MQIRSCDSTVIGRENEIFSQSVFCALFAVIAASIDRTLHSVSRNGITPPLKEGSCKRGVQSEKVNPTKQCHPEAQPKDLAGKI